MIFFWQGDGCSINAKGAVAAISIEIDENGDLHKVGCIVATREII